MVILIVHIAASVNVAVVFDVHLHMVIPMVVEIRATRMFVSMAPGRKRKKNHAAYECQGRYGGRYSPHLESPAENGSRVAYGQQKNDVVDPDISGFNHVGLLRNRPPGEPGCPLFSRPTTQIYS
jgi:hypothetical protein